MIRKQMYWLLAIAQLFCAFIVVGQMVTSLLGWQKTAVAWEILELLEIAASVGLVLGSVLGLLLLRSTLQRNNKVENQLKIASGAFAELVDAHFAQWKLTPAERDVALFLLKGLKTAEIATLRGSREGTVKAQTNAVYRKANVSGRSDLLSLFMEELISVENISELSAAANLTAKTPTPLTAPKAEAPVAVL